MASPDEIIADESSIGDLLPQRYPMVMVGKLHVVDNRRTVSSLIIREDNIFCQEGIFREPGLVENIAQTAAAGAGYRARRENKMLLPGFIGGIRKLEIMELPKTGEEISTEIIIEHEILGATVVKGKVTRYDTLIAECEMKIFLQNE